MVVVYAVDRLSRRQADTLALLEEFERHGAGLAAASQDFDTTSPMGRAMLGMLAVFAELQRAEIRERTRAKLRDKKSRGEATGRAAFGLARSGAGFERDPETWPTVARILSERGGGASCQAIADALNADHVATPTAARHESRGLVKGPGQWHAATVAKLCRNPHVLTAAHARLGLGGLLTLDRRVFHRGPNAGVGHVCNLGSRSRYFARAHKRLLSRGALLEPQHRFVSALFLVFL